MKAVYTRELETPAVKESALNRQQNYEARLQGRGETNHRDVVVEYRTRKIEHSLLEVPPSGYFTRKTTGRNQLELCASKRDGTPTGKPFRCPASFFDAVVRDRRMFPVVLAENVYHLPPDQWKTLRSILSRDGLAPLRGKTFHSLSELGSAMEKRP